MKQEPAQSALVKTKPDLVGIHRPFSKGGEFPGLGVALSAFGVEHGTFVAHAIMEKLRSVNIATGLRLPKNPSSTQVASD